MKSALLERFLAAHNAKFAKTASFASMKSTAVFYRNIIATVAFFAAQDAPTDSA